MPNVTIPLEHYIELVLRHHPYVVIQKDDQIWQAITSVPEEQRQSYVLENEEWTIGFNCLPIVSVQGIKDGYRLWYRKDWELCDNKRQEVVRRIDKAQADYQANRSMMLEAIRQDYLTKGITEQVWSMLANTLSDTLIKDMHRAMITAKEKTLL